MNLERLAEDVGALVIADEDGTEIIFTGEQLAEFVARIVDGEACLKTWLGVEP
jgi:hypothetical protein